MRKGPFLPEDFFPTKFSTAGDKAAFGNMLLHFLELNCKRELFTGSLYDRLSTCYGHIAHCDRETFYENWFKTDQDRLRFIQHTLRGRCWPNPAFTFSDVERAVQREIESRGYLARYELQATVAEHSREMEILHRLEAKHRSAAMPSPAYEKQLMTAVSEKFEVGVGIVHPVQANLFEMS